MVGSFSSHDCLPIDSCIATSSKSTRIVGSSIGTWLNHPRRAQLTARPDRAGPAALPPLHPYGIQRLIKQWGKDQVVNVEQRTSLYRTIERLLAAGLITVRETGRDPRYPERTVYQVTEAGRQTARRWLEEMLAEPRQEYPEFPAALSHVVMLEPAELIEVLERRSQRLAGTLAALDASTAAETGHGCPGSPCWRTSTSGPCSPPRPRG